MPPAPWTEIIGNNNPVRPKGSDGGYCSPVRTVLHCAHDDALSARAGGRYSRFSLWTGQSLGDWRLLLLTELLDPDLFYMLSASRVSITT